MQGLVVASLGAYILGSTLGVIYDKLTKHLTDLQSDPSLLYRMVVELVAMTVNVFGVILASMLIGLDNNLVLIHFMFGLLTHQPYFNKNVEIISLTLLNAFI